MALYIRELDIGDLERSLVVETAAFPPAEAATREKIEYRLAVCPELCFGLFLREGQTSPSAAPQDIPIISKQDSSPGDVLVAHVISTMSENKPVRDEDMAFPPEWKNDPKAKYSVGHQAKGKTIALHSLAVSPQHQRSGFGKALMKAYFKHMKERGAAERISILTYDRLVPYYKALGFEHYGKSESEYAGVAWHDLSYVF
ncbi:hypothetical protein V2G26_018670 [Clonostachys chloroleuca]